MLDLRASHVTALIMGGNDKMAMHVLKKSFPSTNDNIQIHSLAEVSVAAAKFVLAAGGTTEVAQRAIHSAFKFNCRSKFQSKEDKIVVSIFIAVLAIAADYFDSFTNKPRPDPKKRSGAVHRIAKILNSKYSTKAARVKRSYEELYCARHAIDRAEAVLESTYSKNKALDMVENILTGHILAKFYDKSMLEIEAQRINNDAKS